MRWRVKIAIGVGIVLIAAILISVVHHYQLKAEVNAYIAGLKAKGEPLDLAQVLPPPVPADQNDAPSFLKVFPAINSNWDTLNLLPIPIMQTIAPGKAMIGWQQPALRGWASTNSWDDLQKVLDKENNTLNEVLQITNHPQLDFKLNYAGGLDKLDLRYFGSLNKIAYSLSASAITKLHYGDTAAAVAETHSILVMSSALQHERGYWPGIIRRVIAYQAAELTWETLQTTNVTDEQLAELQRDWTDLDFTHSEAEMLKAERAMDLIMVENWRRSGARLEGDIRIVSAGGEESILDDAPQDVERSWNWDRLRFRTKILFWQYWGSYPDELEALKIYDILINTAESIQTNGSFFNALQLQNQRIKAIHQDYGRGMWIMQPDVGSLSTVMYAEAIKQTAVAAIALKRYQIKYGRYPTNLGLLMPEFVTGVPLDPVDGKSLRYRVNPAGTFLLYSIGENGKDDGGINSNAEWWPDSLAPDWVWPQPATADEVQKYYANLGK
jgi:hypothetical protein